MKPASLEVHVIEVHNITSGPSNDPRYKGPGIYYKLDDGDPHGPFATEGEAIVCAMESTDQIPVSSMPDRRN